MSSAANWLVSVRIEHVGRSSAPRSPAIRQRNWGTSSGAPSATVPPGAAESANTVAYAPSPLVCDPAGVRVIEAGGHDALPLSFERWRQREKLVQPANPTGPVRSLSRTRRLRRYPIRWSKLSRKDRIVAASSRARSRRPPTELIPVCSPQASASRARTGESPANTGLSRIGETGFEPATARPPAGCATRLRHSPWPCGCCRAGDETRTRS